MRPRCPYPLRCVTGQPAMLGRGAGRRTHCALRAPFKQLRPVRSRSACACGSRARPAPCASRYGQRGKAGTTRAIAALGLAFAARSACACGAERSDGPYGLPPLEAAPGAGRLRGGMGASAPMLRNLTGRVCLNGAAQQRSELCGPPRKRHATGLPLRVSEGVADVGSCSLLPFLHEQERKSPAGASPGQRHQKNLKAKTAPALTHQAQAATKIAANSLRNAAKKPQSPPRSTQTPPRDTASAPPPGKPPTAPPQTTASG